MYIFGSRAGPSEPTRESVFEKPPIKLNDDLYEIRSGPKNPSVEIVFFHGFEIEDSSDAYWKDWLSDDRSHCWLGSWLVEDFPGARILSVRYDSSLTHSSTVGRMDLSGVAANLATTLVRLSGRVGRGECPVILVGHSVGGLVMKQLLVTVNSFCSESRKQSERNLFGLFLNKVRALFFYATPHAGSKLGSDTSRNSASSGPFLESLEISCREAAILHEKFINLCSIYKWRLSGVGELLETKLVTKRGQKFFHGIVVREASALQGMYASFTMIARDHMNICKPDAKTSLSFSCLSDFIKDIMDLEKNCGQQCQGLPECPVGLDRWMSELIEKMGSWCPGQGGSQGGIVGIVGKAGIGKTSLARRAFNQISRAFEYTCFVDSVKGIPFHDFQNQILCNFHRNGKRLVAMERISWNDLEGSTVLLVMDDVDSIDQLKVLPPRFRDSREGSLLIFTNSGDSLFRAKYENCFEVELLNHDDSRKLFCLHAFVSDDIPEKLQLVLKAKIERLVEKCGGLPRSLEIMGHYLRGQDENGVIWEGAIDYLEKTCPTEQDQTIVVPEESHNPYNLQYLPRSEVGLAPQVDELKRLLLNDQRVAIVGFGGMGKTTLARKLFNTLNCPESYDCTGFFLSVKEQWLTPNLDLRVRILDNLYERGKQMKREDLQWNYLKTKKVLLVLDDVNSEKHLPDFMDELGEGSHLIVTSRYVRFLGDFHVYDMKGLDEENSRKLFCSHAFRGNAQDEALHGIIDKLIRKCGGLPLTLVAVGSALFQSEFEVWEEMLGKIEAQEILDGSDESIWGVLSSCYDALGLEEQEMFLDVASLIPAFQSPKMIQEYSLDLRDLKMYWKIIYKSPHTSWTNLKARRLVDESTDWIGREKVSMHEHFRDLACKLAWSEDTNLKSHLRICLLNDRENPEYERKFQDGMDLLLHQNDEGDFNAKAVRLKNFVSDSDEYFRPDFISPRLNVDLKVFSKFVQLRFLTLSHVCLIGGHAEFPGKLEVLRMEYCHSPGLLPVSFNAERLVALTVLFGEESSSLINIPGLTQALRRSANKLRFLRLESPHPIDFCRELQRDHNIPRELEHNIHIGVLELSTCLAPKFLPVLEELRIVGLSGVERLPDSFSKFARLQTVSISQLNALVEFPSFMRLSSLEVLEIRYCPLLKRSPLSSGLPASLKTLLIDTCTSLAGDLWGPVVSMGKASKLQHLDLRKIGCSNLPDIWGQLRALASVTLVGCDGLTCLPGSFGRLGALLKLTIHACIKLETLDSVNCGGLSNLRSFSITRCPLLKQLPESLGELPALSNLCVEECPLLKQLPENFGHLRRLQTLSIKRCHMLQRLSKDFGFLASLQKCDLSQFKKLRKLPKSFVRLAALEELTVYACPFVGPLQRTLSMSHEFSYAVGWRWKWKKINNPIGSCFSSLEDARDLFESSRDDTVEDDAVDDDRIPPWLYLDPSPRVPRHHPRYCSSCMDGGMDGETWWMNREETWWMDREAGLPTCLERWRTRTTMSDL